MLFFILELDNVKSDGPHIRQQNGLNKSGNIAEESWSIGHNHRAGTG